MAQRGDMVWDEDDSAGSTGDDGVNCDIECVVIAVSPSLVYTTQRTAHEYKHITEAECERRILCHYKSA